MRQELAFYNVGCQEPRGARRVVVPFRRLLRRVLRPIFVRQVEILNSLCDRLDQDEHASRALRADLEHISQRQFHLAEQLQGSVALGWDYRTLNEGLADATARMTDGLVDGPQGFKATFNKITRPRAKANKAVVDALVRGAGEVRTSDGRVTVLLFVDQVVVDRKTAKNPKLPYEVVANRVYMELEKVDGEWLVDEIGTVSAG